jgi:AcrR family transcriptional regulator
MSDTIERSRRPYAPRMAPEERREQLLDAVLRVVVKQGVHKVSMDSVAKEAGVTRPVVYGHFADSNALLRASLRREEEGALAQLSQALPPPDAESADAAVQAVENFLKAVLEAPDRWRAILALVDSSTPAFRKRLEHRRQDVAIALENVMRRAVPDERAEDADMEILARLLLAMMLEAGRLVLTRPSDFTPERITSVARDFIQRLF